MKLILITSLMYLSKLLYSCVATKADCLAQMPWVQVEQIKTLKQNHGPTIFMIMMNIFKLRLACLDLVGELLHVARLYFLILK